MDAAITQLRPLLAARLRVLGEDAPAALATRANLAFWLGDSGQVDVP